MFPCGLAASQETPFLLIAWVSLTVRALLTQPCLVGTGSVGCGGLGQARWGGVAGPLREWEDTMLGAGKKQGPPGPWRVGG